MAARGRQRRKVGRSKRLNPGVALKGTLSGTQRKRAANELVRKARNRGVSLSMTEALRRVDEADRARQFIRGTRGKKD